MSDEKDPAGRIIIYAPILLIEAVNSKQQYRVHLSELDPRLDTPEVWGIVLSDAVDHIAQAYYDVSGRSMKLIRDKIYRAIREESKLKRKDPERYKMTGHTFKQEQ